MLDAAPCGYWNPLLFNGRVFSSRLLCSGARIRGVSRKQRPLPLFYICILINPTSEQPFPLHQFHSKQAWPWRP
jgi:hypothetical protein